MPHDDLGLIVDLGPAVAFNDALMTLEEAWAAVPPGQRSRLSRLVWLHPDGQMVVYAAPDGPKAPEEGDNG